MGHHFALTSLSDWLHRFDGRDENTRIMTLRVFLYIAMNEKGVTVPDIMRDLKVVQSVAHRNIQRLYQGSKVSAQVGTGLDLVQRHDDPEEPPRRLYFLSEKGRRYLQELMQ